MVVVLVKVSSFQKYHRTPRHTMMRRPIIVVIVACIFFTNRGKGQYFVETVLGDALAGDGKNATQSYLNSPNSVALDTAGNIFIADSNRNRIRRVDSSTGIITTFAGSGRTDTSVTTLSNASIWYPSSLAVGPTGIFVAIQLHHIIRRFLTNGTNEIYGGSLGTSGSIGDGLVATSAQFDSPTGIGLDPWGNLFVSDTNNNVVRRISNTTKTVSRILGIGLAGSTFNSSPSLCYLNKPMGIAVDSTGAIYIADQANSRIIKLNTALSIASMVAGTGSPGYSGDGGAATLALLRKARGVFWDSRGLFIADTENHLIRLVFPNGTIATVAGNTTNAGIVPGYYGGDGGAAVGAQLSSPASIASDSAGNLFIADTMNYRVRKVTWSSAVISTVAGQGKGDGKNGVDSQLLAPSGPVAIDTSGVMYVADNGNQLLRRMNQTIVSTVAGTTGLVYTSGVGGDGGPATAALLNGPWGVTLDSKQNVYFADDGMGRVRRYSIPGANLTAVAGTTPGYFDGISALSGQLNGPAGIAVSNVTVYIADQNNHRIRTVPVSGGTINSLAGIGIPGFGGDGNTASLCQLNGPLGLALSNTTLYIADQNNHRIRSTVLSSNIITTFAGNGQGNQGDGGGATSAKLNFPSAVAVDWTGKVWIADQGNHRIRVVISGTIYAVAGAGSAGYLDGLGTAALFDSPSGVFVDAAGNIYVTDTNNNCIRRIWMLPGTTGTTPTTGIPSFLCML